jgi:hypothetical protein
MSQFPHDRFNKNLFDFLGEALLDFDGMSDLLKWLQGNEV